MYKYFFIKITNGSLENGTLFLLKYTHFKDGYIDFSFNRTQNTDTHTHTHTHARARAHTYWHTHRHTPHAHICIWLKFVGEKKKY